MARNRRTSLWASLALSVTLMGAAATPPAVAWAAPVKTQPPTFNVNSFNAAADFAGDSTYTTCRANQLTTTCTLRAAIMNVNPFAGGGATINSDLEFDIPHRPPRDPQRHRDECSVVAHGRAWEPRTG